MIVQMTVMFGLLENSDIRLLLFFRKITKQLRGVNTGTNEHQSYIST